MSSKNNRSIIAIRRVENPILEGTGLSYYESSVFKAIVISEDSQYFKEHKPRFQLVSESGQRDSILMLYPANVNVQYTNLRQGAMVAFMVKQRSFYLLAIDNTGKHDKQWRIEILKLNDSREHVSVSGDYFYTRDPGTEQYYRTSMNILRLRPQAALAEAISYEMYCHRNPN